LMITMNRIVVLPFRRLVRSRAPGWPRPADRGLYLHVDRDAARSTSPPKFLEISAKTFRTDTCNPPACSLHHKMSSSGRGRLGRDPAHGSLRTGLGLKCSSGVPRSRRGTFETSPDPPGHMACDVPRPNRGAPRPIPASAHNGRGKTNPISPQPVTIKSLAPPDRSHLSPIYYRVPRESRPGFFPAEDKSQCRACRTCLGIAAPTTLLSLLACPSRHILDEKTNPTRTEPENSERLNIYTPWASPLVQEWIEILRQDAGFPLVERCEGLR
jgi:hypothetical protein